MESLHENERKRREERGGAGRVVFIRSSVLLCVCAGTIKIHSRGGVRAGMFPAEAARKCREIMGIFPARARLLLEAASRRSERT